MPESQTKVRSLQWRITIRQLPVLILFAVLLLYWLGNHLRKSFYSTHLEFAQHSSLLITSAVQTAMESSETHDQWERVGSKLPPSEGVQFEIVNIDGKVLYATDPGTWGKTHELSDPACAACHVDGSADATDQTKFIEGPHGASYKVFAAPLKNTEDCMKCHADDGAKLGMVFVRQSLKPVRKLIRNTLIGLIVIGTIALALTILSTRLLLSRYLARPLRRLVAGARAIGSGKLNTNVSLPERTELAMLADALNSSGRQIKNNLKKISDQRDDLMILYHVANQLSRSIGAEERRKRAVDLAELVFRSPCLLISGEFDVDTEVFTGIFTYRTEETGVVEKPFSVNEGQNTVSFYSREVVIRWLKGEFYKHDPVQENDTMAYPLERHGSRVGLILTPLTNQVEDFSEEAATVNPEVRETFQKHLALSLELSELQNEMVQREKLAAIGETVAGLAHCLKNTLNGLRGGQYVVEGAMKSNDQEKLQQGWKLLKKGVQHIERLSLDMLYYAGEHKPKLEPINPNDILEEVMELQKDTALSLGVKLQTDFDSNIEPIPLDRTAIYRAILNLATNAIDACTDSETGDTVTLKSRMTEESIGLTIGDNGVGMSKEAERRIFERFFTTKSSKGTGLGLPVVKKIAEEHGGTLKVKSEEGKGSSFTIQLPRKLEEA